MAYNAPTAPPPDYSRAYSFPPTYAVRDPPTDPRELAYDTAAGAAARADDPAATVALSIGSLINRIIISHPCTVLRRQCQVHQHARRLHYTPVTLVPVVIHMISKDGLLTLWKGFIGSSVLYGMSYITEVLISDVCGLPRTIVYNGSTEKFMKHVLLKTWTTVIMTPFYISSFIETVRSGTTLNISEAGIMDVVIRGIDRIRYDLFGNVDTGRRFPVLYLALPTSGYVITHFLISRWAYNSIYGMARRYVLRKPPQERTRFHSILPDLFAAMTSSLAADVICYPIETVLHRLYIQGTRTLIDNLDTGVNAISLNAKYNGFIDCFSSIVRNEGAMALYSGIGAIALQYCLQFCVLRGIRWAFEYATDKPPAVNVNHHPVRSGPTSHVSNPSAQFAAVETPTNNVTGPTSPQNSPFPSFAQTSASIDVPPVGQLYNNFTETNHAFGGSTSPPIYQTSPVRSRNDFLLSPVNGSNDRSS